MNTLKFLHPSSNIFLCATTPNGNVLFYTKPLPSCVFNPTSKSNNNSDQYISQTFIKKNVHSGDLYAVAVNDIYIAIGGADGKISYWSSVTGAFKSYTRLITESESDGTELFIIEMMFLKGNFILVILSNGVIHVVHPASSRVIQFNIATTVTNAFVCLNSA